MLQKKAAFKGNLCFSSVQQLKNMQVRFQDDIESLLYIIYYCIFDQVMPWEPAAEQYFKKLKD